jgi:ABC-2 type transport system ATP-binding protein
VKIAVEVNDLTIAKNGVEILHGISLQIPQGKIVGLLGPSGSGKTTLMRTIAGLQRITSGSVSVLGVSVGDKSLREAISYSTQDASIYGDLTVDENLQFFASLFSENEYSIDEILKLVDLLKNRKQLAQKLSGGERARLALATALVGKPQFIILDEPTVGLDPVLRKQLWGVFRMLTHQGKTLLVSSHVMDEAENCDHLILLRDGKVLAEGSVAQLKLDTEKDEMEDVFISLVRGL